MAAKSVIKFVLGQFAKRSARNTGIPKILNANDSIVQSNARSIENILKNHGYNPSNMSSDDILNAMNYHKAMMDQRMTQEFKRLELSKGVDDLAKKPPFQGFTPTIVKDKTLFKDSPERIAKMKADNKAALERLKNKKKTVEDFRDEGDFDPGGMASGGIAGQLHLNQGGRAGFANGSPAVDPRMLQSYEQNKAENEAQRQINQAVRDPAAGNMNPDAGLSGLYQQYNLIGGQYSPGGAETARTTSGPMYLGVSGDNYQKLIKDMASQIMQKKSSRKPTIAEQVYKDMGGGMISSQKSPISFSNLATSPESRITNEAQANELAELMAPGSTQSYRKPTFEQRMGGESWDMLSDGDQYKIAQEYPGQTPPRRNLGFIPGSFAKGGLAKILGV